MTLQTPGNAQTPAAGRLETSTTDTLLPAGTVIEQPAVRAEDGTVVLPEQRVTLNAPTTMRRQTSVQSVTTSTGPTPPTPAELAKGKGVQAFWLAGLAAMLAGGLLLWRQHWLAGILAILAGVSLPILATVLSSTWAVPVGIGLLAASVALFCAWHILKPKAEYEPDLSGSHTGSAVPVELDDTAPGDRTQIGFSDH